MSCMERVKVGVIGCGMISEIYLKNITGRFTHILEAYACASSGGKSAERRAEQFGIRCMSVEELLADPAVEIVLDLTVPGAHAEIGRKALLAGKHHYSEKPLAVSLDEGKSLIALAKEKGLYCVSAPDTFLGGGIQTCLKLLNEGAIGTPVFAQGLMLSHGPETFHPDPKAFYAPGGGPLLDMGPYYYTALLALLGPARRVSGTAAHRSEVRIARCEKSKYYGQEFPCLIDTTVSGTIEFESGVIANVTTSWDMVNNYWDSGLPLLEVFGTEGTLTVPDPNTFGGLSASPATEPGKFVRLRRRSGEAEEIPITADFTENSRGLGLAELAKCIREGGTPRISNESSLHVLEMLCGVLESSQSGASHTMTIRCEQPAPFYDTVV